jgi:Flp pilus assembly protein TadD
MRAANFALVFLKILILAEISMKQTLFLLSLCSLMVCLGAPRVYGQTSDIPMHPITIHGVVRDAVTHAGINHVEVTLDREDSGFIAQTETDGMGRFTFEGPGAMVFIVTVKFTDYQNSTQRIDLSRGSSEYLNFDMQPTHPRPAASAAASGIVRNAAVPENAQKEYDAARQLFEQNKAGDEAIRHLKKAIDIYPKYADAYVLLAMANIGEGKLDDAHSSLDKAISIDPKLAEAHLTLGMLLNHQQDWAGAEKSLSRGLELNPDAPQGHYELAKTYWAMGKWQDAEPHAQKAVALNPDLAPPHVLLGNIALRKRDPQAALKEFQEYLRLDPSGPMAGGAQQMVTKIEQALKAPAPAPQ